MSRVVLITGVGRRVGIAAGIAERLASDGWDIAITHWTPYDDRMPWGRQPTDVAAINSALRDRGARVVSIEADLADPDQPSAIFDTVEAALGPVRALIMSHAESVDSGVLDTTVESFDRHFAVNARASWLLIREFATRFTGSRGTGRIVALTSDHTVFNLPYGASKAALDRIVIAAARELAELGVTSNVINPGPVDTGWMTPELAAELAARTPAGRLGTPRETAALVSFLLSDDGGWINGQLLYSDGGFSTKG
ncbi:MAG: short-chain dehydrogenase/reductase [Glaciihabitans sp.]|nr:short-chain dehydrogenase/reductase [Glaciihabitans sp.]MDQ1570681.1 3-oxoacyl-[acyl-carrier protein] reductase [Actinomycetota bacterium]